MFQIVAADEALANEAAAASQAIRDDCESDLSEAEPALISATNALNTLKCSDITVIKAMKNPPSVVKLVKFCNLVCTWGGGGGLDYFYQQHPNMFTAITC